MLYHNKLSQGERMVVQEVASYSYQNDPKITARHDFCNHVYQSALKCKSLKSFQDAVHGFDLAKKALLELVGLDDRLYQPKLLSCTDSLNQKMRGR